MNIKTKEFIANLGRCPLCGKYLPCGRVKNCHGIDCVNCPLANRQDGSYEKNNCSCDDEDYYNEILQLREEVIFLQVALGEIKPILTHWQRDFLERRGPYGR
jgi:hypothetical protein